MSETKPYVFRYPGLSAEALENLVLRLAKMLTGQSLVFKKPDSSYVLGPANNWFFKPIDQDLYMISYKSGDSERLRAEMETVRKTVAFMLGLVETPVSEVGELAYFDDEGSFAPMTQMQLETGCLTSTLKSRCATAGL